MGLFQAITPPTRPPSIILGEKLTATTTKGESLREQGEMGEQTFPGDFVATTVQPSLFASSAVVEVAEPEPVVGEAPGSGTEKPSSGSNLAAQPDSYSMFQHLMEAQVK